MMEIFLSRPSSLGLLFLLLSIWVLQDMEDYLHLGETHLSRGGFVHNTSIVQAGNPILYDRNKSTSSTITSTSATMQQQINNLPVPASFHGESFAVKTEGSSSHHNNAVHQFRQYPFARESVQAQANCEGLPTDMDSIKAKIVAHPQYSSLLDAFMSCQKVGASPEVVKRLSEIRREIENRQRSTVVCRDHQADPELDQFMEAFNDMLLKYQEELTRPLQEAVDFMRRMEAQLSTLTNGAIHVFPSDEQCEGAGSSEEDQDGSGGEGEAPEVDPRAEERELKHHLLKKYSGYLSSLKQELSKKKKKGKLPKDARQKLLHWWELHYKWPYPSESEKVALAESTGLDQKQINNWFINQRKRHWKPSEDMQFVVMDGLQPQNTAFYMDGHFKGDGPYRFCP